MQILDSEARPIARTWIIDGRVGVGVFRPLTVAEAEDLAHAIRDAASVAERTPAAPIGKPA